MGARQKNYQYRAEKLSSDSGRKTAQTNLGVNAERVALTVQNQNNAVLYVKLGTGASATDYHFALKACSTDEDGEGGSMTNTSWLGAVSFYSTPDYLYTIAEEE